MSDHSTSSQESSGFHGRSRQTRNQLPLMARLSYRREMTSWIFVPLMLGGLQGGTIAIFLKKTFADVEGISADELNLAVSVVAASKAMGHLVSFFWAGVSRGRRKVQFMFALQLITAGIVAAFAFAPRSSRGLWMVTGLSIAAWTIWSGFTTLRATVWRANYAGRCRPRIAGHIMTIDALLVAAAGLVIGLSLDLDPMTYRFIFPVLAIAGVVGSLLFRRIPFRRETRHIAAEREANSRSGPSISPMVVARVLSEDRWYRGYMACMFTMGFGNLMLHPVLAIALTDQFNVGYQAGIAIATVIPLVCLTFAIPFWGRRLARMHVIDFRAVHAWSFACVSTLVLAGVAMNQLGLLYAAAVVTGIGWGGGALAWNLGHQHFAPPHRDAEYMGVHITLTGIRGVIGPIFGVLLYTRLARSGQQTTALLICFTICLVMNIAGAFGFTLLSLQRQRSLRRNNEAKTTDATAREEVLV